MANVRGLFDADMVNLSQVYALELKGSRANNPIKKKARIDDHALTAFKRLHLLMHCPPFQVQDCKNGYRHSL